MGTKAYFLSRAVVLADGGGLHVSSPPAAGAVARTLREAVTDQSVTINPNLDAGRVMVVLSCMVYGAVANSVMRITFDGVVVDEVWGGPSFVLVGTNCYLGQRVWRGVCGAGVVPIIGYARGGGGACHGVHLAAYSVTTT